MIYTQISANIRTSQDVRHWQNYSRFSMKLWALIKGNNMTFNHLNNYNAVQLTDTSSQTKLKVNQKNKFWNAIKFFHTRKPTVFSSALWNVSKNALWKKKWILRISKESFVETLSVVEQIHICMRHKITSEFDDFGRFFYYYFERIKVYSWV